MAKIDVLNIRGEVVGDFELADDIFGAPINTFAVHQVVRNYLNNQRQGTQSTLTRSEVSGGGRKPWRQKGSGRARQGSTRSPQWYKGGVVFAPKPRDYGFSVNKKIRRIALKSALSDKLNEKNIIVLDELNFDAPRTKDMIAVLEALKVSTKALIVTEAAMKNVYLSTRNIPGVDTTTSETLNVYDILNHDKFIITKEAAQKVQEVYA